MTNATLDRILAVLVTAAVATGLLTLRVGAPSGAFLYAAHGILAWVLAATMAFKLARSAPRALAARRWVRLATAGAVTLLASAAIGGGVLWATGDGIVSLNGWTLLTLHAYAGLALLPLLLVHLVPRRWRLLWPGRWLSAWLRRASGMDRVPGTVAGAVARQRSVPSSRLSRRSLLGGAALWLVGLAGWGAASMLETMRGGARRFTGSRWLPAGGIPPPTTFLGEATPAIEVSRWRLTVRGRVARPAAYTRDELLALERSDLRAVLDCTSGWAMETIWSGVPMAALLGRAIPETEASRTEVRSVTGWSAGLSLEEARETLLATHVAGEPLSAANGAPCRLVVPDRRGLDWVKWVTEIVVA